MSRPYDYLLAYIDSLLFHQSKSGGAYFTIEDILNHPYVNRDKTSHILEKYLTSIIHDYLKKRNITQNTDEIMGSHYSLTPEYVEYIRAQLRTEGSILSRAGKFGNQFFSKVFQDLFSTEDLQQLNDPTSNPGSIPVGDTDSSNHIGEVADDLSDIVNTYEDLGLVDDNDASGNVGFTLYEDDLIISDEDGNSVSVTLPEPNSIPSMRRIKIPASDRVVQLDHNSEKYKEAIDAVDAVINAIAGDNEYGNSFPEEKETVVSSLKAGRKLLDAQELRPTALGHTLFPVLQYIADNFAKGVIAALGATAMAAVMGLI